MYLDVLQMQSTLYSHKFFQHAARSALTIFLHLIDSPEDIDGLGEWGSSLFGIHLYTFMRILYAALVYLDAYVDIIILYLYLYICDINCTIHIYTYPYRSSERQRPQERAGKGQKEETAAAHWCT